MQIATCGAPRRGAIGAATGMRASSASPHSRSRRRARSAIVAPTGRGGDARDAPESAAVARRVAARAQQFDPRHPVRHQRLLVAVDDQRERVIRSPGAKHVPPTNTAVPAPTASSQAAVHRGALRGRSAMRDCGAALRRHGGGGRPPDRTRSSGACGGRAIRAGARLSRTPRSPPAIGVSGTIFARGSTRCSRSYGSRG